MSEHDVATIKTKLQELLPTTPVTSAKVFGSFARGQQHAASDIDILIELPPEHTFSLLDMVALEQELELTLGRNVDVVTRQSISKYIRCQVLQEAIPVYHV